MMRASERVQGNFALFRRTLAAYQGRVNLLTGDEVLPRHSSSSAARAHAGSQRISYRCRR